MSRHSRAARLAHETVPPSWFSSRPPSGTWPQASCFSRAPTRSEDQAIGGTIVQLCPDHQIRLPWCGSRGDRTAWGRVWGSF